MTTEQAFAINRRTFIGTVATIGAAACIGTLDINRAFAVTSAEKQAEAAAALDSLNAMEAMLAEAESNYGAAMVEFDNATASMEDAQQQINETTKQIEELQEHLGTRARSMYRSGANTFLDLLVGSSSWKEFTTNWDLLNELNKQDSDKVEEMKQLRLVVQQQKEEYEKQQGIAKSKTDEMAKILEEISAMVAEQETIYNNLSAEAAELLAQEQEAEMQRQAAAAAAAAANTTFTGENGEAITPREPVYVASTGNSIVDRAYSWVGNAEYSYGAVSPGLFDCSGFVSYCLSGSYTRLGSTSTFLGWNQTSDPQPGDVCVNAGHCGIYIGNGQMIHSATEGVGVTISSVQDGMVFVRQ